jgi:uncharacterized RDD family membrane protein YckC
MQQHAGAPRERAGIGSRAYAFLIDWHIRLLAALGWFAAAIAVLGTDLAVLAEHWRWSLLPPALLYFLYHPVLELALHGDTPGKRTAGLRTVTRDGRTPGVGALLTRNLLRVVDSLPLFYALGLVVMFCTREQVRIGDLVAGTVVVYDEPRP